MNIEGRRPVLEALRSDQSVNKILLAKGERHGVIREILSMAKKQRVVIQEVPRQVLDAQSETGAHQGVMAETAPIGYLDLPELITGAKGARGVILALDGLQDPHNVGALLRTAEATGAAGMVLPKHRAVAVNATVFKASSGAAHYVPVCRVVNLANALEDLKKAGFWVVGADSEGELAYSLDLQGPLVLVIGSEGKGISRLIKERCDMLAAFPMQGQINSLNASVAGSLLMYEVTRQRLEKT